VRGTVLRLCATALPVRAETASREQESAAKRTRTRLYAILERVSAERARKSRIVKQKDLYLVTTGSVEDAR